MIAGRTVMKEGPVYGSVQGPCLAASWEQGEEGILVRGGNGELLPQRWSGGRALSFHKRFKRQQIWSIDLV